MKELITKNKVGKALVTCCLAALVGSTEGQGSVFIKLDLKHVNGIGGASTSSGLTSVASGLETDGDADNNDTYSTSWAGAWKVEVKAPSGAEIASAGAGNSYGSSAFPIGSKFLSFCTDIGNSNGDGTFKYKVDVFSSGTDSGDNNGIAPDPRWVDGGNSGKRASRLYNAYVADANNTGSYLLGGISTDQGIRTTALALAIWEVLYQKITPGGDAGDNEYDVDKATASNTVRNFKTTGGAAGSAQAKARALANFYLDETVNADGSLGPDATWFQEQANDPQSLIGPPSAVPEPSTYVAGALLLLPFFASTLRARRKHAKS